jgi:hypothetical protein
MKIKHIQSGKESEAIIELLEEKDFKAVKMNKDQFGFNWAKYKGNEVYKLYLEDNNTILGLMCIIDHTDPATNAIEIELLEVGRDNVGKGKKIGGIGGCLIAFACRESFKRGHDGFVFLTPKTGLIKHYNSEYGLSYMPPLGNRLEGLMIAESNVSISLIKKYIG